MDSQTATSATSAPRMSTASFQASATSDPLPMRRPMRNFSADMVAAHGHGNHEDDQGQARRRRMVLADGAQRVPAHADAAGDEDQADDEGGQRFDPAVAVGVVLVGRLAGDDEADQHDRRRQHVAGELDAGGEHRRGLDVEPDADVQRGEHRAGGDAGQRDRRRPTRTSLSTAGCMRTSYRRSSSARISALMFRMYAAVEMPTASSIGKR